MHFSRVIADGELLLFVNQRLDQVLKVRARGGDDLPVLSLIDNSSDSSNGTLGLDSEVVDLQSESSTSLIYHSAEAICVKSF